MRAGSAVVGVRSCVRAYAVALAVVWCGCEASEPASDAACVPGDTLGCACADGASGRQLCLANGDRGACMCAVDHGRGACAPGAVRACQCADGARGEQVCLAAGGLSRCVCAARSGPPVTPSAPSEPVPQPEPPVEPQIEPCCGALGSCVPERFIPEDAADWLSADRCQADATLCVPDVFADPRGAQLQPCRAPGALEGRCAPACLPDVHAQADRLVRDLCPREFLCVPCFDPYSGAASGVCELGLDPGPIEPPVAFGACCEGLGACVPRSLVPEGEGARLPVDACDAERGLVCAPEFLLDPDGFILASCRAFDDLEGRCVAGCLLAELGAPPTLPQADCAPFEACVPCFDPFSGAASGACGLGDDPGPAEPAVVYARCCEVEGVTLGSCVPASVLPVEAAALPQESCASSEARCVPDSLRDDPSAGFARCSTLLGGDGACVPECMVPSPQFLIQGVCAERELCVPCSAQGMPTGVCPSP